MQCIVLERSESLRYTGGAIGIMANGWRALHQLGVDSILKQTADPIVGSVYPILAHHLYTLCI